MDLKTEAKKRYDELVKQKDEIDGELKGLEVYLKAVGLLEGRKRKRRTKKEVEAGKK